MTAFEYRDDNRDAGRRARYLQVQFRPLVGRPSAARVADVSEAGFRLLTTIRLTPGLRIWIKLSGLESRQAKVVWWNEGEAGCRFTDPVHPAVIELLMQKHKRGAHEVGPVGLAS